MQEPYEHEEANLTHAMDVNEIAHDIIHPPEQAQSTEQVCEITLL